MAGDLGQTALAFVSQYGHLAIVLFTFLEASLLFPLLPSEVIVPGGAAVLVRGPVTFGVFVTSVVVGTTAGSLFAYHVFGLRGHAVLTSYGSAVGVSEERLERGRRWFRRWGESATLWGRLLPVVRSVISIPAGIAGMPRWKFTLYSAVGAGLFGGGVAGLVVTGTRILLLGLP